MTLIDKFNFFFNLLHDKKLSPSSQLVYLHYLHFWNLALRKNSFYCSDRDIAKSTGLSLHSITDAKRVLKNFGLINWRIVNGRTKIFLPENERYTSEDAVTMQIERNGDKFTVSENNIKIPEREKERVCEATRAFRKVPSNSIDVAKNEAARIALQEKLKTPECNISAERREFIRKELEEFGKRHNIAMHIPST